MSELRHYRQLLKQEEWQTDPQQLPTEVAAWLLDTASLTQKLQQICQQLAVQVTAEQWQTDNNPLLSPSSFGNVWVREVCLYCDNHPCIFAQTMLPQETIEQVAQEVLTLGDMPIGLWLFPQNPTRLSLEWTQDHTTGLYARRSLLLLHGYPLAIYELFLPDFPFEA